MRRKTDEHSHCTAAPIPLGDDELSAVSGAKGQGNAYGHTKSHGGPPWLALAGTTTIVQNIDIDITQVANTTGDVTQIAGALAGNSSTIG